MSIDEDCLVEGALNNPNWLRLRVDVDHVTHGPCRVEGVLVYDEAGVLVFCQRLWVSVEIAAGDRCESSAPHFALNFT